MCLNESIKHFISIYLSKMHYEDVKNQMQKILIYQFFLLIFFHFAHILKFTDIYLILLILSFKKVLLQNVIFFLC